MMEKKALKSWSYCIMMWPNNKLILDKEKEKFINQIKQIKKEDLLPKPPEPLKN
jgi:hypothetical protein